MLICAKIGPCRSNPSKEVNQGCSGCLYEQVWESGMPAQSVSVIQQRKEDLCT